MGQHGIAFLRWIPRMVAGFSSTPRNTSLADRLMATPGDKITRPDRASLMGAGPVNFAGPLSFALLASPRPEVYLGPSPGADEEICAGNRSGAGRADDDLQDLRPGTLARRRGGRNLPRRRHRRARRLHPFLGGYSGRGDRSAAFPGRRRSGAGRRRRRLARIGAALGAGARRCSVPAPLRRAAARQRALDQAAAARRWRPPRLSGARPVIDLFDALARPLMGLLEAENAHRLAVNALKLAPLPAAAEDDPHLAVRAFGLNFRNPVGMAAGFDKHSEVPDALLRLGFGAG